MNAIANLYIAGSLVDRGADRITLQSCRFGPDVDWQLNFSAEVVGSLQGPYSQGQAVKLDLVQGGTTQTVFAGFISSATVANLGTGGICVGYSCAGLRFLVNQIFTTGTDGTGTVVYNLATTDDDWAPTTSGLTVANILYDFLSMHSAQLASYGVSIPPGTAPVGSAPSGDYAALAVTPLQPVIMQGGILNACENMMSQWAQRYQISLDPGTLELRIVDMIYPPVSDTFSLEDDPITVGSLACDCTGCYTRVVIRGGPELDAATLDQTAGDVLEGWTSSEQAAWTWSSYTDPPNSSLGTITAMDSLTVVVHPTTGITSWATNYWVQSVMGVSFGIANPLGAILQYENREVVACTATSSGFSTITVDSPFTGTAFAGYKLVGPLTGASKSWRVYEIPNSITRPDGSPINLHLAKTLNHSVAWSPTGTSSVVQVTSPQLEIFHGGSAGFGTLVIYPSPDGVTPGYLVADQPTVSAFSSLASMNAGTPDGIPTNTRWLIPYSLGALHAAAPTSGYEGTAYSVFGWQETFYYDIPSWQYSGQVSNITQLAQLKLDTMKNAVIEGSLSYYGCPIDSLALGRGINLTGGLATGSIYESMNCVVRSIGISWPESSGSWQTVSLGFSNKRRAYCGDSLFVHPILARGGLGQGNFSTMMGGGLGGKASFGAEADKAMLQNQQQTAKQNIQTANNRYTTENTGTLAGNAQNQLTQAGSADNQLTQAGNSENQLTQAGNAQNQLTNYDDSMQAGRDASQFASSMPRTGQPNLSPKQIREQNSKQRSADRKQRKQHVEDIQKARHAKADFVGPPEANREQRQQQGRRQTRKDRAERIKRRNQGKSPLITPAYTAGQRSLGDRAAREPQNSGIPLTPEQVFRDEPDSSEEVS